MSFLVTARKFRPKTFQEVVAQKHVVNTLLNAIRLNRTAHAYLFCGPRGVGKTTTARIFAKALNCRNAHDGEPCNACDTCREIGEGRCIDVIEIDGASNNGVDQVRNIRDSVRYVPAREKYKMYIIDEVHMLSTAAFNALLKTLEEPPAHALFVFATTEVHKLPPTVVSRCQRFDFKRMTIDDITGQLRAIAESEQLAIDEEALHIIAKKADGSMRDAQSIFDQVVAFAGSGVTGDIARDVLHVVDQEFYFRITDLILAKDTKGGFFIADELIMSGFDPQEFVAGLEEHLRNLLVVRSSGATHLIEATEAQRSRYQSEAMRFTEGDLLRLLTVASEAMREIRSSTQPRLALEIALIRMIKMDSTVAIETLIEQLEMLKAGASLGGSTAAPATTLRASQQPYHPSSTSTSAAASRVARGQDVHSVRYDPAALSFDAVLQQWKKFTETVRSAKRTLGLNLEQCTPATLANGTLQVVCSQHFQIAQFRDELPMLTERFSAFFGSPVQYEFLLRPSSDGTASIEGSAQRKPVRTPPSLVKLLVDEFSAEILS